MSGEIQSEKFHFEALLGTGSFGQVFLVKRKKDGKQYVIKRLQKNLDNNWIHKMMSAEVECLQILRHPNIVSYYGAWEESDYFYIQMEYAARGTLKDLLDKRTAPLLEKDALYLFAQIVLGVHHIHSKSILHRDLKPDNIMLTGHMGDIVKIGDFGLSRDLSVSNMSHAGSYYYIAPEMLKKVPYDFQSDIWSMGVILYEMLTKEIAFPASSFREIFKLVTNDKPLLFENSDVSFEIQVIVYKMLQQDPAKRPTTQLLLLCPMLVRYIAKVYLNLGRCYKVDPPESLGFEMFEKFLVPPKAEESETKL